MASRAARTIALAVVTLSASAKGASLRATGGRLRGCGEPEGSEIIKGPDCGSVQQVIPIYQNAAEVGKLQGDAQGAVTQAASAAEVVARAKTRAGEIAAALGQADELPQRIKLASDAADEAATASTQASTALETSLETFRGKVAGSTISGADVEVSDKSELTKLTDEANAAAKVAHEAAARVLAKASEAQEKAMSDTGSAVKLIKTVIDNANPTLKAMPDVAQKSEFAVGDAAKIVAKADEVAKKIGAAAADAGDQAPVWQALKQALEGEKAGVSEQQAAVTAAIEPLNTAAATLKGKVDPLKKEAAAAAGGAQVMSQTADLVAAERAQDEAEAALFNIEENVKILTKRQDRLQAKIDEAEKKLSKDGAWFR